MDESFFSDSILEFINDEEDEEEFENIDYLFGQIPDEVLAAVVDSASSEQRAEPLLSSCSEFKRTKRGIAATNRKKQKREQQAFKNYVGKTLPKVGRRTRLRSQHCSSSKIGTRWHSSTVLRRIDEMRWRGV